MGLGARRRLLAAMVAGTALAASAVAAAPAASAHPLGNFTVNYYSGIQVEPHAVEVDLVVDRAEVPTLQAFPDAAAGHQPVGADTWRANQCALLAGQTTVQINGSRVPLTVTSSRLEILAGAAGLATSRLECTLRTVGSLEVVGRSVSYRAAPTSGRVGWHEVTARGNGTTLVRANIPELSLSKELTQYPQDLLSSPLDQRTAGFEVRAGSGLVTTATTSGTLSSSPFGGLDRLTDSYTDLVSRADLTPVFVLLAIVLSVLLGGLHAFAPGHGKTLMAAFLVGREGTWRQAAVIGLSVTVTHTIGVLLLAVALSAAALAAPEQVYPWLGLLSGVLLAGIGVTLLRSARHRHPHGPHGHTHGLGAHTHERFPPGKWRLAAVGLAGGLVPSPSALLVLLGGMALGRAWFGAILVLFYGMGMAAALVGTGLLLVVARDRIEQWSTLHPDRGALPGQAIALRLTRDLPMLTAVAVMSIGASLALRSLLSM